MNKIIFAIGDIHGRIDLLTELHRHIINHYTLMYDGFDAEIVYLGDYIDHGAHSLDVIDELILGIKGFGTTYLLGNHEAMMLECLSTDNRQAWYTWLSNGGEETLGSIGMSLRFGGYDPEELCASLGERRVSWLKSLPLYHILDPYLFVHAGIVPGVPLEEQQSKDLLWIRSRFLDSNENHGYTVVHGHTPGEEPVVKHNRICVDTSAVSNGVLTAAVLDGKTSPTFLRTTGRPGKTG